MKKGFTLIELLVVILIIGIIASITFPIVIDTINSSKQNALKDSAYSLVSAANTYQLQKQASNETTTFKLNYSTATSDEKRVLKIKGKLPDAGEIEINENGKVTLALWGNDARACVVKNTTEKTIRINKNIKKSSDCLISNIDR